MQQMGASGRLIAEMAEKHCPRGDSRDTQVGIQKSLIFTVMDRWLVNDGRTAAPAAGTPGLCAH